MTFNKLNIQYKLITIVFISVLSGSIAGWIAGNQSAYGTFKILMKQPVPIQPVVHANSDSKEQPNKNNQTIKPLNQISFNNEIKNLQNQIEMLKKKLGNNYKDKKEEASIMEQITSDYSARKEKENYINTMMQRSSESIKRDVESYGNTILELYNKSHKKTNATPSEVKEADDALMTLTQQFPKSEITGIVIAERALQNAMEKNYDAVEQYYQLLTERSDASNITTGSGVDALPALQAYLVSAKLSSGNIEEASKILSDLNTLDSNRYIAMPPKDGTNETFYITVGEFCEKIYNHIKTNNNQTQNPNNPNELKK